MSESEKSSSSKGLLVGALILGAVLILIAGGVGFGAGRASAEPEVVTETVVETVVETITETITETVVETVTETVTEEVEVTREVVREVEVPSTAADSEAASSVTGVVGNPEDIDFDVFYQAWRLVEQQFDGDVPENSDVLYSAIEGSLETLGDEHTRFVRPDVAARNREDAGGSIEGIGAFVRENDDGQVEILRPIKGQAADLAGMLPGDIILAVDGEDTEQFSFDEVILMVRGPRGTDVVLTILREGEDEPFDMTITRVRFEVATVEYELLDDNIGYIHLRSFDQTAEEKTLEALADLLEQGAQSLIYDVRDNPGGFLYQAVAVSDIFLPESVILYERNNSGLNEQFDADDGDVAEEIPLVVLVNPGSASASEILAGAVQDHDRGVLIGETSFGKGSVQQAHELDDGSEMRVTIARWYTPDNNSIDDVGITPDIEVPMAFDSEEDIQLERAIEYLLQGE